MQDSDFSVCSYIKIISNQSIDALNSFEAGMFLLPYYKSLDIPFKPIEDLKMIAILIVPSNPKSGKSRNSSNKGVCLKLVAIPRLI